MKRLVSLITAVAICISIVAFSAPTTLAASVTYADISGHWAQGAITRWTERGVIRGNRNMFMPDELLTRAQVATIGDQLMKWRVTRPDTTFNDVAPGSWYENAVRRAASALITQYKSATGSSLSTHGILQASNGLIQPEKPCQRQEAAVIIARMFNIPVDAERSYSPNFGDSAAIDTWARPYVYALQQNGILVGDSHGNFNPKDRLTRAEFVTMLDKAVTELYSEPGQYSGSVSGTAVVNASGVILNDMRISGDLIIAEGVGDGSVELYDCTIIGTLFIQGARAGVTLSNCSVNTLDIRRNEGQTTVLCKGGTSIENTIVYTSAELTEDTALTGAGFRYVETYDTYSKSLNVDIVGDLISLTQNAADAVYNINGTIEQLIIGRNCGIRGSIGSPTIKYTTGAGFSLNGVQNTPSASEISDSGNFANLYISPDRGITTSDRIRAVTAGSSTARYTYQWYYATSSIGVDDSGWLKLNGQTGEYLALASTIDGVSMVGKFLMVEVSDGYTTKRAKTYAAVETGGDNAVTISVDNYTTSSNVKNETIVVFTFAHALELAEGYDLMKDKVPYFKVTVTTSTGTSAPVSTDDSYISSAIYSASSYQLKVQLHGEAAKASNEVRVQLNDTFVQKYYSSTSSYFSPPIAFRASNVATWQDYSFRDMTPPTISNIDTNYQLGAGTSANVLRIEFNEPLGYKASDGVIRQMPNDYDIFGLGATTGVFAIKVAGETESTQNLTARYNLAEKAILIRFDDSYYADSITLSILREFMDLYGNMLTVGKLPVFYRRASQTQWYAAYEYTDPETGRVTSAQEVADYAARAGGSIVSNGLKPTLEWNSNRTQLYANISMLNIKTGLTYQWYRYGGEYTSLQSWNWTDTPSPISGATQQYYAPTAGDYGHYVFVRVSTTLLGGVNSTVESEPFFVGNYTLGVKVRTPYPVVVWDETFKSSGFELKSAFEFVGSYADGMSANDMEDLFNHFLQQGYITFNCAAGDSAGNPITLPDGSNNNRTGRLVLSTNQQYALTIIMKLSGAPGYEDGTWDGKVVITEKPGLNKVRFYVNNPDGTIYSNDYPMEYGTPLNNAQNDALKFEDVFSPSLMPGNGARFIGWYTTSSGGVKPATLENGRALVYYAHWEYEVTFVFNGVETSPQPMEHGQLLPTPASLGFDTTGVNFVGWAETPSGTTSVQVVDVINNPGRKYYAIT